MNAKLQVIAERDNWTCWLCGRDVRPTSASADHLIPKSKGGKNVITNLKLAHKGCNSRRGNKPLRLIDTSKAERVMRRNEILRRMQGAA